MYIKQDDDYDDDDDELLHTKYGLTLDLTHSNMISLSYNTVYSGLCESNEHNPL